MVIGFTYERHYTCKAECTRQYQLSPGSYKGTVTVSAQGADNSTETISVQLTVTQALAPIIFIVPGFGASTLTDYSGTDQWLSCQSILNLNKGIVRPIQYTSTGSPVVGLNATSFLTQKDTISDDVKPSNQKHSPVQ